MNLAWEQPPKMKVSIAEVDGVVMAEKSARRKRKRRSMFAFGMVCKCERG